MRIRNRIVVAGLAGLGIAAPAYAGYTLTTLSTFDNANGSAPKAGVTIYGDNVYGTTSAGGDSGLGTVFSTPLAGGTASTIASFNIGGSSGFEPEGAVIVDPSGATVYGTTTANSTGLNGAVFSVPIGGGTPTALATFTQAGPNPDLLLSGGTLYGTTHSGGSALMGTVFSVPTVGGPVTTLATFNGADGLWPTGGLVRSGNKLYGTTSGLSGSGGSVFSVPVGGGTPTTLCTFSPTSTSNGIFPEGDLLLSGTTLYGTTSSGPGADTGTVFSVPIAGGSATTLATFDGPTPQGALTLVGKRLYGIADGGGADNDGLVYSLPLTGGAPATIVSFTTPDATGNDADNLIADGNGDLFGTLDSGGGTDNSGTVFELSPTAPGAISLVPEPSSLSLLAIGALGLLGRRRRSKSGN
jgi:uncharacterized repeat protein (TIGR03803 family)